MIICVCGFENLDSSLHCISCGRKLIRYPDNSRQIQLNNY